MYDVVIFGGTEEGRLLAEFAASLPLRSCACVATEYGSSLLTPSSAVIVHQGRMDAAEMASFLNTHQPRLVLDATHPYAREVSENIRTVCQSLSLWLVRLVRPEGSLEGCRCFSRLDALIDYLNTSEKTIFSTTGAKEMLALTNVQNFQERVWLRMLPTPEPLAKVIAAGYPGKHLICMQGPFSEELNRAMFRAAGCDILVTKESGSAGGFREKVDAALALGMEVCVLLRPGQEQGISLEEAKNLLQELCV